MASENGSTRDKILRAALRRFADCGYAGASVQQIAADARVTKPTLYYHFQSKAGLYRALVDWAQDERLRMMQSAAGRTGGLAAQLTEVVAATFEFVRRNRGLTRLGFVTAFAASGEVPRQQHCLEKGRRNFEFVHELIRQAAARGQVDRRFDTQELAIHFYGVMSFHVMLHLVAPEHRLERSLATRIVALFLSGAASRNAPARSLL